MNQDQSACQWLRRREPETWRSAEAVVTNLYACCDQARLFKAQSRWDFIRRVGEYRADCDAIHELRNRAMKNKRYRSAEQKAIALSNFRGNLKLAEKHIDHLLSKWDLGLPHGDAGLLFLDYQMDFKTLLTGLAALVLAATSNAARAQALLDKWSEAFTVFKNADAYILPEIRIMMPHETKADGYSMGIYLEVTYGGLSSVHQNSLIEAFADDESVHCFAFESKGPDSNRLLTFKIALPGFPMMKDGGRVEKIAAPVIDKVCALAGKVMRFCVPAVGPHIENRSEAIANQLAALDGQTDESRSRSQARKKIRSAAAAAGRRAQILSDLKQDDW